jgi:Periplasmic copper-binding protein (NosD)
LERLLLAAITLLAASVVGPISALASGRPRPHTAGQCDLFASPNGFDGRGRGGFRRPFRTLRRLDEALRPGQTGCLRGGTYGNTNALHYLIHNGTSSGRITITSYPGETATVVGWVSVDASYTTLSHLRIDGSNDLYRDGHSGDAGASGCPNGVSQPLALSGHDDILQFSDYFQSVASLRGTGIGIGFGGDGNNTVVRFNKIHDVGQCEAFDHLIYLSHGNNVQIYGNWMWGDPHGRGVQLYPAPTNARVFGNVIDHAGEGFVIGNDSGENVSGNQIYNNIITGSTGLPWQNIPGEAIHDYYVGAPGSGNTFHDNISYRNPGGMGRLRRVRAYGNRTLNPHFINAAAHDYRVQPSFKRRLQRLFSQP